MHLFKRQAKRFRTDLRQCGMQALAHVHSACAHADAAIGIDLYECAGLCVGGHTWCFHIGGHPPPYGNVRWKLRFYSAKQLFGNDARAFPYIPVGWVHHLAQPIFVPRAQQVFQADFLRLHAQFLRRHIHQALYRQMRLRMPIPAGSPYGRRIGIYAIHIQAQMLHAVRAGARRRHARDDIDGIVGIPAAAQSRFSHHCEQLSGFIKPQPITAARVAAMGYAAKHFFTA